MEHDEGPDPFPQPMGVVAHSAEVQSALAQDLVARFGLVPHVEGGHFCRSYTADAWVDVHQGRRPVATAIYYLLVAGEHSSFHCLASDELWHHYDGGGAILHILEPGRGYRQHLLGGDYARGEQPQALAPAGSWFAMELAEGATFAFFGCTVAPGFDYADFTLADPASLAKQFPEHQALISRLCPSEKSAVVGAPSFEATSR